ncbi:hypothetical protein HRbin29_01336 [bacterium HR29]|jgi:uncharacterized protein (DUF58 family)|nr:hypothetical protein HRbin29_01336 [bacterium HR29]
MRAVLLLLGPFAVLLGLVAELPLVSGLGFLLTFLGLAAALWHRELFAGTRFRVSLADRRLFPGEQTTLTVELENRKLLPLPWFEWQVALADPLRVEGERLSAAAAPGFSFLRKSGTLGWYARARWQFRLGSNSRGYHQIGPATVKSSDILGLEPQTLPVPSMERLVVYPRIVSLPELGLPADRPFGDAKGRAQLFEDPLRIKGLREYRPGDPLRRIDWKATARLGELASRVYEPSAARHLYLLLNVDTLPHSWEGYLADDLERTVTVAASIAAWAHEHRHPVGLLANGSLPDADRPLRLPPSASRDQLVRILEALAMVQPLTLQELASVIRKESGRWPLGATVVLVASLVPEELAAEVVRLHAQGYGTAAVLTSERADPASLGPVPVYRVLRLAGVAEAAP